MLYLPYGEIWIDEGSDPFKLGYKFTGKEMDEETGYSYFGARYYDPQVSQWISTDPAVPEYLPTGEQLYFAETTLKPYKDLKGLGGIYNTKNMGLYTYTHSNPIKLKDPDGKAPGDRFTSVHDAALDFGKTYNDDSIRSNREFGASIYAVTDKEGVLYYTYTIPNKGNPAGVKPSEPPPGKKILAILHTHGAYDKNYKNNKFSPADKKYAKNKKVWIYVATPQGTLQNHDPKRKSGKRNIWEITDKLPSDSKDPDRVNKKSSALGKGGNKNDPYVDNNGAGPLVNP